MTHVLSVQAQKGIRKGFTCLNNNGPSTHDRVIPNAGATSDNASVTDVDVFAYVDFASSPCTLDSIQWSCISRLLQSRDGYASTNLCVPSHCDSARVEQSTVRPNDSIVSNGEVIAIFAVKRRRHIDAMTQMAGNLAFTSARVDRPGRKNLPEEPRTLARLLMHSCVEAE